MRVSCEKFEKPLAMTEFEAATFQNATLALHKASLAQGETSNLIGFIQCGLIAAGLLLMFYFNRTRDRAQARADAEAQRKHEAAQLEAQRHREEAERTAHRDEAERRHDNRWRR